MARNQGPPSDDPFYRRGQTARNSYADDSLPLDAGLTDDEDEDEQNQFRRANKRVSVRRSALPKKTASRMRAVAAVVLTLAVLAVAGFESYRFATHSWRFRVRSENDVQVGGEASKSRAQVLEKMREDVGRNVFQIPLAERKRELEKIPWVESAAVIRLWPNQLRVVVKERTPVGFVALGERVELVDAQGVLMEMPSGTQGDGYSFPVILGMNENEPLSTRAPRMRAYMRLMRELDEGNGAQGAQYSRNIDEVDLSDPEDVKVLAKGGSAPILLHLGKENFLSRFMVFLSNVQKWEQERGKLESVDMRYGREVILNPDTHVATPPAAAGAAKTDGTEKNSEPAVPSKPRHRAVKKRK